MQKSQCLYLAQGNGILQLEGETEEKTKKKNQKLISVANEDKKTAKHEQNSNQKNNNRQNKTQEIEKINGNRELSPSLLFLCFFPLQT